MGLLKWVGSGKQRKESEPATTESSGVATTPTERRTARDDEHRALFHDIRESKMQEESTAAAESLITVRGESYHYWGPTIADLKRENRLDEALALAMECAAAAERDPLWQQDPITWRAPAPAWTDDCCIIARKLGKFELEIALLERWASNVSPQHRAEVMEKSGMGKRLDKSRALLAKRTVPSDALQGEIVDS